MTALGSSGEDPGFDQYVVESSAWRGSVYSLSRRGSLARGHTEVVPLQESGGEEEHIGASKRLPDAPVFACNKRFFYGRDCLGLTKQSTFTNPGKQGRAMIFMDMGIDSGPMSRK